MKKTFIYAIKIAITTTLIFVGIVVLTNWKLNGFTIFDVSVTPETINAFEDSIVSPLLWIYVVLIVFIIWKKWIRRK